MTNMCLLKSSEFEIAAKREVAATHGMAAQWGHRTMGSPQPMAKIRATLRRFARDGAACCSPYS